MPLLIGIAGPKRSGKDTLARLLCQRMGLRQDSFAAPLRRFVSELCGLTPDMLEMRKETPIDWLEGVTPRRMMQTVGTEWGRSMIHPDLWVRSMMNRLSHSRGTVISDVRFPNEAEAILANGGIVIAIDRPGASGNDSHISELALADHLVTFRVRNTGLPADLLAAAIDGMARRSNPRVSKAVPSTGVVSPS